MPKYGQNMSWTFLANSIEYTLYNIINVYNTYIINAWIIQRVSTPNFRLDNNWAQHLEVKIKRGNALIQL